MSKRKVKPVLATKAIREKAASGFCFCPEYERTLTEAIALLWEATDDANGMVHCHDRERIRAWLKTVEGDE